MPTVKLRAKRAAVVVIAAASLVGLAGCRMGFEHQTLQQYTQAEGINLDLAGGHPVEQGRGDVKVRNLMIIAQPDGSNAHLSGVLYGSPSVQGADAASAPKTVDTLQSVSGRALQSNGNAGGNLTVSLPKPVEITVEQPVKLETEKVTVSGAKLTPGIDAELTLTFQQNGRITTRVPVIDGSKPDFRTSSPQAEASSIPSAAGVPSDVTASPAPGQPPQQQN